MPSFEKLLDVIVDGFHDLSLSTQQLTVGVSAKKGFDLSNKFIFIQEHQYSFFFGLASLILSQNLEMKLKWIYLLWWV